MDSGGLCDDPVDLSMLFLKLFAKCLGTELRVVFVLCRAGIGISLDGFEIFILQSSLLKEFYEDNIGLEIGLMFVAIGLTVAALIIVGILGGMAVGSGESEKRKYVNRFFITFKTVNLILAVIILAGTIYGRSNIVTDKAEHIFLLVSLGLDILLDPFELIFAFVKFVAREIRYVLIREGAMKKISWDIVLKRYRKYVQTCITSYILLSFLSFIFLFKIPILISEF